MNTVRSVARDSITQKLGPRRARPRVAEGKKSIPLPEPRRVVLPLAAAALFTASDQRVLAADRPTVLPVVWAEATPALLGVPARWTGADDAMLKAEVIDALLEEVGVDALGIDVATKDRAVVLRGAVPSAELRQEAARVARAVTHVVSVADELLIKEFKV